MDKGVTVTRGELEKALWRWSGWKADQRLVDELLTVIDRYAAPASLDQARRDAQQIVQSARDEAAAVRVQVQQSSESPSDAPAPILSHPLQVAGFQDADGVLWVSLGSVPDSVTVSGERRRKCSGCGGVKPIARYRKDSKSVGGRKRRCMDCENEKRREKRANRLVGSGELQP